MSAVQPPPPPADHAARPAPPLPAAVPSAGPGKALPSPFVAVVDYTLRACLPAKRWWGVILPCLGAIGLGLLSTLPHETAERAFATTARQGLFGLILPLTCLVVGDAIMGADVRAGTFPLTWLSPVRFHTIVLGRWLGGWLVTLVTLVPAFALAAVVAGVPQWAWAIAVAGAFGSAAYVALFLFIGVVARRAAVWSLAVVFLGERLLGQALSGVAQLSPLWEAGQAFAGLVDLRPDHVPGPTAPGGGVMPPGAGVRVVRDGLREGMPHGTAALVRLVIITVVCLGLAVWRIRHVRPGAADD